jgi:environmental stress-induced protein Ves
MTPIDVYGLPASPWKNSSGQTRTITVSPADAGFENFDWRVSVSDVASSAKFSPFPGVDRTILLLDGAGMILQINSRVLPLTAPFQSYSFSGDDVVRCRLVDGPTRDFNVMTRRGRAHAEVHVCRSSTRLKIPDVAILFCARGAFHIDTIELKSECALRLDRPEAEINLLPQTNDAVIISVLITKEP